MWDDFVIEARFQPTRKVYLFSLSYKDEINLSKWRASLKTHLEWWGQVFINDSPSTLSNVPPESCWVLPAQGEAALIRCPLKGVHEQGACAHLQNNIPKKNHSKIACAAQSSAVTWPKREVGLVQQLVTPARELLVFALDKPGTGITRLQNHTTHFLL